MPLLEEHDELGFPWDDWADGKVHRLVRGKDFARSSEALTEAAENAGRRLGRVARTVTEVRYGRVFFWFQFLDQELYLGDPCRCGSSDLRRVNKIYARCASCGATAYVRPLKTKPEPLPPPVGDEAPLLAALLGGNAPTAKGSARGKRAVAPAADPRTDLAQLGAYVDIRLSRYSKGEETERLAGLATEAKTGAPCLVVVDYPLSGGQRIEALAVPGGFAHRVQSLPTKLFAALIRVDELAEREPDVEIDDPFAGVSAPRGGSPAATAPAIEELSDVTLLGRGETRTSERYIGYGTTPSGEHVLLSLRYRLDDGARALDPRDPDQPRHELRCVPSEPFAHFVELEELLSAPDSFRLEEGAHPPKGTAAVAGGGRRERKREGRERPQKQRRRKEGRRNAGE
jgi:hypothetical protein